jgi:RimJ/RimL family protein N-acetyltransferase
MGGVSIFAAGKMSLRAIETSRGTVTIRATTADDATRLRAMRVEALTSSPTSFGSAVEDIDSHDWTQLATGDANHRSFIAEHAGELVGHAGIHRSTRPKERHHADIWGVFVRPAFRRSGVAQACVTAAVDWARETGVSIVKLTVVPESGAMGCYLRCGFRVTGVDPAALRWEGKDYDEVLMSRRIDRNAAADRL